MRIISSFNDYYDSAMSFLSDHEGEVVFERKHPADFSLQTTSDLYLNIIDSFDLPNQRRRSQRGRFLGFAANNEDTNDLYVLLPDKIDTKDVTNRGMPLRIIFSAFSVLFCGKTYQGIRTDVGPSNSIPLFEENKRTNFFYDVDSLFSFLESYPEVDLDYVPKSRYYKKSDSPRKQFNLYFSRNGNDSSRKDFLIEHKLSIAIYHGYSDDPLEINGKLSDVQFYKVFDAYTAFQELDMWVSGILASPPNFMVELSDESKIGKAGFDPEYGFRTRPNKQQKKRKPK